MKCQIEVKGEQAREFKTKSGTGKAHTVVGVESGKEATLLNFVEVDLQQADLVHAGKLTGKTIVLSVTGAGESFSGRIRLQGTIASVS